MPFNLPCKRTHSRFAYTREVSRAVIVTSLIAVLVLAASRVAQAQQATRSSDAPSDLNPWFVRVAFSPSRVIAATDFRSGGDAASNVTIELGRQTDGTSAWHRVYNYPSFGVGFYSGRFEHRKELGEPFAAYGFFSWPFPVAARAQVTSDVDIGVSWHWNEFDPQTNPTNTALGSDAAYYIGAAASLRFVLDAHSSVYGGARFMHWSNGGTKQPNLGLATIGPYVGVRYNFAPQVVRPRPRPEELPPFAPYWEFVVGAGGSQKNITARTNSSLDAVDRRRDFRAFNITAALQRGFYRFGKAAVGADLTYDGGTGARVDIVDHRQVESRVAVGDRFALGLYGGYEHVIARFSILAQLGYQPWRGFDDEDYPPFYQRYGSRFYVTRHLWGTFAVRTVKGRRANFVEFGAGYSYRTGT